MRFAHSWLLDYLDTQFSAEDLALKLSDIGIEAEVLRSTRDAASFVVAKVVGVTSHPSADRLNICKVFDGTSEFQVVCGASNVRSGMLVVLARIGAIIPKSGITITTTTIRGVESYGMLCSADELDISSGPHDGIIDLSGDSSYKTGDNFFTSETVIEVSVTPNRGDCLGLYGIARELCAAGVGALKSLPSAEVNVSGDSHISVDACSENVLFSGRYIKSVRGGGSSPKWIRDRLVSSGIKTGDCVIDIVNYVMLILNRPMHVYDASKIRGGRLVVHRSKIADFSSLDGKKYSSNEEHMIVTDGDGNVHCVAGIIGSDLSKFTPETQDIFLESAWYDPVSIALSSRELKISTESSYRFERFTDPELVEFALDFATKLIIEYCGGSASRVVTCGKKPSGNESIDFNPDCVGRMCNAVVAKEEISRILRSLGFSIEIKDDQVWKTKVPSWRADIHSSADLVEEVLRIYGYDKIQEQKMDPMYQDAFQGTCTDDKLRLAMLAVGLTEVITLSFIGSGITEEFGYNVAELRIENPISSQFDTMRPSILPGILRVAAENQAHGCESVAVFEFGDVYLSAEKSIPALCGLRSGNNMHRNPHSNSRRFDFFDAKFDVLQVFATLGVREQELSFRKCDRQYLHPGRSADIYFRDVLCGYVGEVHPDLIDLFELKSSTVCFEVFLAGIPEMAEVTEGKFLPYKYQDTKRDFAFLLDSEMEAGCIVHEIRRINYVKEAEIFDVYEGSNIPEGSKSVAIAVTIASRTGTMTEAEIKNVSDEIVAVIAEKFGGKLRLE